MRKKFIGLILCTMMIITIHATMVSGGFIEGYEPIPKRKPQPIVFEPEPPKSEPQQSKKLTVKSFGINYKMVLIEANTFTMGSPENEPGHESDEKQHQVTISKSFYMGVFEVTQGQWEKVMGKNPSYFKNCGQNCPVESVSWKDVQKFLKKLNRKEGTNLYRLPTEAEWEYAARAGSQTTLPNGRLTELKCGHDRNLDVMGWYCGNSGVSYKGCYDASKWGGPKCAGTHPVGRKKANAWGLYDMSGNVWEWCEDWYKKKYPSGSIVDPQGPSEGSDRVIRGGSWGSYARNCRPALRSLSAPARRCIALGLRFLRSNP